MHSGSLAIAVPIDALELKTIQESSSKVVASGTGASMSSETTESLSATIALSQSTLSFHITSSSAKSTSIFDTSTGVLSAPIQSTSIHSDSPIAPIQKTSTSSTKPDAAVAPTQSSSYVPCLPFSFQG